jgi:hypothetical protein
MKPMPISPSGARIGRGEQGGIAKTEDSAEGEGAENDGYDTADPAAAERGVVAECLRD